MAARNEARRAAPPAAPQVTEEEVRWGFRLLAGREPVNAEEFAAFLATPGPDAMRRAFTNLGSFHAFFDAVETGFPAYAAPLFLLRPPATEALEWRFAPPTLDAPVTQLCTDSQYDEPGFHEIVAAMGVRHGRSRALWEQAWIIAVLAGAGLVAPGHRVLGLATGRERVAAVLAARGVEVRATGGGQVADEAARELRRLRLFHPEAVHIEEFDRLVSFDRLDPRAIGQLTGESFDACWSLGLPARSGSVEAALATIEASLAPLRPGGLALHAFAFNISSDATTWELPNLVLPRRRDIEALAARLAAGGHRLLPLNTHPGHATADAEVTSEPGPVPAHRQRHGLHVATSLGLAIRKAG